MGYGTLLGELVPNTSSWHRLRGPGAVVSVSLDAVGCTLVGGNGPKGLGRVPASGEGGALLGELARKPSTPGRCRGRVGVVSAVLNAVGSA
jgi:hypothetical protein